MLYLDDCVEGREEAKNRQRLDDKWEVISGDIMGRAIEGTPMVLSLIHIWRDCLTMQTNFDYTLQDSRCERWERFITEVTCNDPDKAEYLQKALGYSCLLYTSLDKYSTTEDSYRLLPKAIKEG